MFIQASGEYIPQRVVDNEYFSRLTGKPVEWFHQRTGILERRRAASEENANTMAIAAVQSLIDDGASLADVDMIVGASYTPWDTIGTMAHAVQRQFALRNARALYLSTACSSFIDALEIAAAYMQSGRARRALVVAAEHNSLYSRDEDEKSGHLWGDGAAAMLIGAAAPEKALEVIDIGAVGLADYGRGPEAISLRPHQNGLVMLHGRDVFAQACQQMATATRAILARNELTAADLRFMIPHQANRRIIDHVREELQLPAERVAITIDTLGNTGCASVAIALHRNRHRIAPGEYAVLVTFGGGYSAGTVLVRGSGGSPL